MYYISTVHFLYSVLSRKLNSRYRFQEPSLELRSKATWAGGPVRQLYAYLVASPHSGIKVTDTGLTLDRPTIPGIE